MRDDELIVFGTESAKEWTAAIAPLGEKAGVKILSANLAPLERG